VRRKKQLPPFDPARFEKLPPAEKLRLLSDLLEALDESLAASKKREEERDPSKKKA
jgi:hypothetical protein